MKLLIVVDEIKTGKFLRRGFTKAGFVVTLADGLAGMRQIETGTFDLILLDIMQPGLDGLQILRWMRGAGQQTPVLIVTARNEISDRVQGLELGADDYVVKPFVLSELLARVRAVLRRTSVQEPGMMLRIADLELDLARHKATRGGHRIDLTEREFTLLSVLVQHAGEVLTRTLIAEMVWNLNSENTNVVDVNLGRLRNKLDDPFPRKLLRTVRGVGYVLEDSERI